MALLARKVRLARKANADLMAAKVHRASAGVMAAKALKAHREILVMMDLKGRKAPQVLGHQTLA
jgi:hypothetical protein